MGKRRITPAELGIGTILQWDAYDDQGRLLLRRGLEITSDSQVSALIQRGLYVELDAPREKPPLRQVPTSAVALILEARQRLQNLCGAAASRENFDDQITRIRELVAEACALSQDAALAMTLLERNGRYSIRHSVDVAIACHVAGSALGLPEPELTSCVSAALTMNISILELQDELQSQQEPLSDAQREVIRRHPDESVRILRERGVTDPVWLDSVLAHHETIDGTGYVHGRSGDDIPLPAQLVQVADVYCARISSRDYRAPLRPNAALRALFLDQGKKVRDGLANHFIKAIGVFPAGTPVRLENGEIAVVTQRGENAKTPHVCTIIGIQGMPLVAPIKRDTSQAPFTVREVVNWSELGAPPSMQSIWGKVAAAA